jgi:phenylacetate-CoA ligase
MAKSPAPALGELRRRVRKFAEYVQGNNLSLPPVKAISVTASMLHVGQLELIQRALTAKVYDTYRTAEIPWIAAECTAQNGLHVLAHHRRVEVLDFHRRPAPAGAVGDVIVTDFGLIGDWGG